MAARLSLLSALAAALVVSGTQGTPPLTPAQRDIAALFSNVTAADVHAYDLKDDRGLQMSCVHVREAGDSTLWGGHAFLGFYHSRVNGEFEVRVASSDNLMTWTFRRTLLANADMPFVTQLPALDEGGSEGPPAFLLAHEQWMRPGSQAPSQLGFKLYADEAALSAGRASASFTAPIGLAERSKLEGTPSLYQASWALGHADSDEPPTVTADVGFHFNDDQGKDQVARARLSGLGLGAGGNATAVLKEYRADAYNNLFIRAGAVGNIGQREGGSLFGVDFVAQEANVGPQPPTQWDDWRVWLYFFGPGERGPVPRPRPGSRVVRLAVQTHKGSTGVGNPSWRLLSCPPSLGPRPGERCLFVSYFIFGEGAKPGEAGVAAFVRRVRR
jgi:hypothetical protein